MRSKRLDIRKLPSPYREILEREVKKLKQRKDVVAIGLAGSVARGDIWLGSDLDIEVIVKGNQPKKVVCTEQEISVDYGHFGESQVEDVPHDTVPIYDPTGILTKTIRERSLKQLWNKMIQQNMEHVEENLAKIKTVSASQPYSTLCLIHRAGVGLGSGLILAVDMAPSVRRTISKLEKAMVKIGRQDIFKKYLSLYGMPQTVSMAHLFYKQLREGYKEIWQYFKDKSAGPIYMLQQPSSEPFFQNRIAPLYSYDKRDLVWIVYNEYHFVLQYIFRTIGREDFPAKVFKELEALSGPIALWTNRYHNLLELVPNTEVPHLLKTAKELQNELKAIADKTQN